MNHIGTGLRILLGCTLMSGLLACSSADDELERFIADTNKQSGGRVEPLPEVKPYQSFVYSAATLRSPSHSATGPRIAYLTMPRYLALSLMMTSTRGKLKTDRTPQGFPSTALGHQDPPAGRCRRV